MNTLSNERLEQLAVEEDMYNFCPEHEELNALARELLALRKEREAAVPVAYLIGDHYLMHAQDPKVDKYASAVPLYTAPPAQPVAAPEELLSIAERLVDRYIANKGTESEFIACLTPGRSSVGTGGVWDDWKALDAALSACRAAMIKEAK